MSNYSLNHSNITNSIGGGAQPSTDDTAASLIYGSLYIISTCGILGTLLTLSLTFLSSRIKGDYKHFIWNVAVIDLINSVTWLVSLLSLRFYSVVNLPVPLVYVLSIIIFSSYLAALTAPLPGILSRFVIFRRPTGLLQYNRFFTKKHILIYFIVCDCYPFFIGYMAAVPTSIPVRLLFATIFMITFIVCYFLVGCMSLVLYRVMRRYAMAHETLNSGDNHERKQVAMAFLYLGIVPLCCQFFQLIYAVVYIYALYWGATLTGPFWNFVKLFLTTIMMYGIAINPIVNIIIVFAFIKPYKTALINFFTSLCWKMKPPINRHSLESINLAILPADQNSHRRSTLRTSLPVVHH